MIQYIIRDFELNRYDEQCVEYICQILDESIEISYQGPAENIDNYGLVEDSNLVEFWLHKYDDRIVPFLNRLKKLKKLWIEDAYIETFPIGLFNHPSLEEIRLLNSRMVHFHPFLVENSILRVLWIHNSNLKEIPNEISNFHSLEELSLFQSNIETLPNGISCMKNLKISPIIKKFEKKPSEKNV